MEVSIDISKNVFMKLLMTEVINHSVLRLLDIVSFLFNILRCFSIVSSKIESTMLIEKEQNYSIIMKICGKI